MAIIDVETREVGSEKEEEIREDLRGKVNNLFTNAQRIISKEDFIDMVKTVAAGVRHVFWLACVAGINVVKLIAMYVKRFIQFIKSKFGSKAADEASDVLDGVAA